MARAGPTLLLLALLTQPVRAASGDPAALPGRARQVGALLGLAPLLDQLASASPDERARAREELVVGLLYEAMAIDQTVARISSERAEVAGAVNLMQQQHDTAVTNWNISAIIVGSTTTVVGTATQFGGEGEAHAGDIVIIAGSAVAAVLGSAALLQRTVARLPTPVHSDLLAAVLGRRPQPGSDFPPGVWRYLDTPLAGGRGSIRQQLLEKWRSEGRLPVDGGAKAARRLELLTSPLALRQRVEFDVLTDRGVMLADLEGRVAEMNVELSQLLAPLRSTRPAAAPQ